jgi:plasmid stability protein
MCPFVASLFMARTTLDLDQAVLRELRRRAAQEGKSISQVAAELLAKAIDSTADLRAPEFHWIGADLGRPLIDLEDPEAIRRALT